MATASRRRTALARAASAEAEEGVPRRVALGVPWDRDVYGAVGSEAPGLSHIAIHCKCGAIG